MKMPIASVGKRGKQPKYQAKIGTHASTVVLVKRDRTFEAGQRMEFVEMRDVAGQSLGATPRWKHGMIWKVEGDRLFINL